MYYQVCYFYNPINYAENLLEVVYTEFLVTIDPYIAHEERLHLSWITDDMDMLKTIEERFNRIFNWVHVATLREGYPEIFGNLCMFLFD
uniref:Peptidase_M1 domain-containing protein n=1 Tax=Meloidogyne hapla TaxID=6305 RepID=A0A1I8BFA7_MELHA